MQREAIEAEKLRPLGQPQADIKQTPDEKTFAGNLIVEIEVEVRPELKLKEYKGLKVKVDEVKVAGKDIEEELDALRGRFGTLKTVDRPAKKGDFTTIDLKAVIEGKTIDSAENISYEIGAGNLLDGIDEALDTLTAGESTTFKSKLVGGDKAGQEAEIAVTLTAVKERELPEADDEFAPQFGKRLGLHQQHALIIEPDAPVTGGEEQALGQFRRGRGLILLQLRAVATQRAGILALGEVAEQVFGHFHGQRLASSNDQRING